MDVKRNFIIRGFLIFLSLVFFYFSLSSLWSFSSQLGISALEGNLDQLDLEAFSSTIIIVYIIIALLLFKIGFHWTNFFKSFTSTLISFAIIFLTFAIILFTINSGSDDLVYSIQDSIDILVLSSLEEVIDNNVEIRTGDIINLILSKNIEIRTIYYSNLSSVDAELIVSSIGFDLDSSDSFLMAQLIISSIYEKQSENSQLKDVAISLDSLDELAKSQGIDLDVVGIASEFVGLKEIIDLLDKNEESYINIIVSEDDFTKKIIISSVSDADLDLIWNNLGLNDSISIKTKSKVINIALSYILIELEKQGLDSTPLPIASLSSLIPSTIKQMLNYDILSENLTVQKTILPNIRKNCKALIEDNKLKFDLDDVNSSFDYKNYENDISINICEGIILTEYDIFMKNVRNITVQEGIVLPEFLNSNIEDYDELSKLKFKIEEKTSNWIFLFLLFLILMGLSFVSYSGHFKLFDRKFDFKEINYYIAKINICYFLPTFLFLAVIIYVLKQGIIYNILVTNLSDDLSNIVNIVLNTPLFQIIFSLMSDILIYYGIYLVLSIIAFALTYHLLSNDSEEEHVINEKEALEKYN